MELNSVIVGDALECRKCGTCCMEMNSPPFMPSFDGKPGEVDALPPHIRESYESGMDFRESAGWPDGVPCFWLTDDNLCRYYEHRPMICREHQPGDGPGGCKDV